MPRPDEYTGESDAGDLPEPEVSERSRGVAVALGFLGGFLGLHRFYVGKPQSGVLMILTFGGLGVWWLYDMILLATGEFRDGQELPIRRWSVDDPGTGGAGRGGRGGDRRLRELEERVDQLNNQFDEMAERVDFAERMLAQHRERQLPRG